MANKKKTSKKKPIGKRNKPSESIKVAPEDLMEKAYSDLKPGLRSSNAELERLLRANAHPPAFRAQVAETHETQWKKVKTEIINKRKSHQQPQDKDELLDEKMSRVVEEEREEEKLINNPHRYYSLMMRIEDGLKTGLSEDDRVTVLAALDCGTQINGLNKYVAELREQLEEIDQWRVAYFKGEAKQRDKRFRALVKKLGLTKKEYMLSPWHPDNGKKVRLVKWYYLYLLGDKSTDTLVSPDFTEILRENEEALNMRWPVSSGKESKVFLKNKKIGCVRETRRIFNKLVELGKIGQEFWFGSDHRCYQFLRNDCKVKGIPKILPDCEEQNKPKK